MDHWLGTDRAGLLSLHHSLGSLSLTTITKSMLPTKTPSTDGSGSGSDRATSLGMRCPLRQVDLVHSPRADA